MNLLNVQHCIAFNVSFKVVSRLAWIYSIHYCENSYQLHCHPNSNENVTHWTSKEHTCTHLKHINNTCSTNNLTCTHLKLTVSSSVLSSLPEFHTHSPPQRLLACSRILWVCLQPLVKDIYKHSFCISRVVMSEHFYFCARDVQVSP